MRNPLITLMISDPENLYELRKSLEINKGNTKFPSNDDNQGYLPFSVACLTGNLPAAKILREYGADIFAVTSFLLNPLDILILRCQNKNTKPAFIYWLTEILHMQFRTYLHAAAFHGDISAATYLLEVDNPFVTEKGEPKNTNDVTPLHYAMANENFEMAELLLTKGANINAKDGCGNTPLHYAVLNNQIAAVKFLLKKSADICAQNATGTSPLHYAAEHNYLELAELLVSEQTLKLKDNYHLTPLKRAVYSGRLGMTEFLLDKGGMEKDDDFPLFLFALHFGQFEIVEFLCKYCSEKSIAIQKTDKHNRTATHYAVCARIGVEPRCVELDLLIKQPELWKKLDSFTDNYKCTSSLWWLYEHKKLFLKESEDDEQEFLEMLNAPDKDGHTSVHYAATYGCENNLRLLQKLGADFLAVSLKDKNALHFAIGQLEVSVVDWLLREKFDFGLGTIEKDSKYIEWLLKQDYKPHLLNGMPPNIRIQMPVNSPPREHFDETWHYDQKKIQIFLLLLSHDLVVFTNAIAQTPELAQIYSTWNSMKNTSPTNALRIYNKLMNPNQQDAVPPLAKLVIADLTYSAASHAHQTQRLLPPELKKDIQEFPNNFPSAKFIQVLGNKELYSLMETNLGCIISVATPNSRMLFQKALNTSTRIIQNTELTASHKFFILHHLINDLLDKQKTDKQEKIILRPSLPKELATLLFRLITQESLDSFNFDQLQKMLVARQAEALSNDILSIINNNQLTVSKKFIALYSTAEKFLNKTSPSVENLIPLLTQLADQAFRDQEKFDNFPTLKKLAMLVVSKSAIFNSQGMTPSNGIKKLRQFAKLNPELATEFNLFRLKLQRAGKFDLAPNNDTVVEIYYLCEAILQQAQSFAEMPEMEFDLEAIAVKKIENLLNTVGHFARDSEQLKENIKAYLEAVGLKYRKSVNTFKDMKNLLVLLQNQIQGRKALLQGLAYNNEPLQFSVYQGWWPLNAAIDMGLEKIVLQLLNKTKTPENFKNFIPNSYCETPLKLALTSPNPKLFEILLNDLHSHSLTEEIWQFHNANDPLLLAAAKAGRADAIALLLKLLPDKTKEINLQHKVKGYAQRVLHNACASGDLVTIELVSELCNKESIEAVIDSRGGVNRLTPLSMACWTLAPDNKSGPEIIKYLVKQNPEALNAGNMGMRQAETPLQFAILERNLPVIKELLTQGAKATIPNHDGLYPFGFAIFAHDYETMKLLMDEQILADHINKPFTVFLTIFGCPFETLLHAAVTDANNKESVDIIKFLLDKKANVNALNYFKNTPLLCIDSAKNEEMTCEILELLINKGANISEINSQSKSSILHNVAGDFKAMQFLFANGLESNLVNQPDSRGDTPLHKVGQYRGADIDKGIELLFKKGAMDSLYIINDRYQTPLHSACYYQNLKALQILFDKFVKVAKKPVKELVNLAIDSNTMLHDCLQNKDSESDQLEILTFLLQQGANVNAVNSRSDDSPLHLAIKNGNLPAVKLLLANGADACLPNKNGDTPLHYAVQYKYDEGSNIYAINNFYPAAEMVEELLRYGAAQSIEKANEKGGTPAALAHNYIKPILMSALEQYKQSNTEQPITKESNTEPSSFSH